MYDLFLSYNRADAKPVLEIQKLLEASGIRTFLDAQALPPGMPWPKALEDALSSVKALAAFIGKEIGVWQKREIQYALNRQAEAERQQLAFPVIPVLLPGSDPSIVPGFLKLNTWVDLSTDLFDAGQFEALRFAVNGSNAGQKGLTSAIISPYRGLHEFREQDAAFFRGREKFADRLFKAVNDRRLVALVGNSGSGKSSVAQAGLIPMLRRQSPPQATWDVALVSPKKTPFYALAEAIAPTINPGLDDQNLLIKTHALSVSISSGEIPFWTTVRKVLQESNGTDRLLLIVDQFEELFTLVDDGTRSAFVKCLLEAIANLEESALRVLLIFRADFYGRVIGENRDLSDLIELGVVNLGPMTRDEMAGAIEQPAKLLGFKFQSGLISRILDDAGNEPGSLPLVEFALTELAQNSRRSGDVLTHEAYDAIGQIAGSLAKRADQEFERLTEQQRALAPGVFTRLVRVAPPGESGQDTRQLADITDLGANARAIIAAFVKARLLVTGRDEQSGRELAQVAHEALIRKWAKLESWVNDQRQFLLWRQRLSLRINEWEGTGQDPGALLYKALLAEARSWQERCGEDLSQPERSFIAASEELERQDRQRLSHLEQQAAARRLAVESTRLLDDEPAELERSVLLSIEALRRLPVPEVYDAFMKAFELLPKRITTLRAKPPLVDARFSPDGKWIVMASESGEIRVIEIAQYREQFQFETQGEPGSIVFSPDSRYLAVPVDEFGAVVWDLQNGKEAARVVHQGERADKPALKSNLMDDYVFGLGRRNTRIALFRDGSVFATAHPDLQNVLIWTLPGGRIKTAKTAQGVTCVAFRPIEGWFAFGLSEGDVWLQHVDLPAHAAYETKGRVNALAFSPDGQYLAAGSMNNHLMIVSIANSNSEPRFLPQDGVKAIAFSGDGARLATLGGYGEARVWMVQSGNEIARVESKGAIESISLAGSGTQLAATCSDRTARIFQIPGGTEVARMTHPDGLISACFGASNDLRLSASKDGTVHIWQASWNGIVRSFHHESSNFFVKFIFSLSPDGMLLASRADNSVRVWSLNSKQESARATFGVPDFANDPKMLFSPNGEQLLLGDKGGAVLCDSHSLKEIRRFSHPDPGQPLPNFVPSFSLRGIAFSPNGLMVATSDNVRLTRVWNVSSGDMLFEIARSHLDSLIAFSNDNRRFAAQAAFGEISLCDLPNGGGAVRLKDPNASALAFSENSGHLATAGRDGMARVWNLSSGGLDWQLKHAKPVNSLVFVSQLGLLVTSCEDGTVSLWNLSDGSLRRQLQHATAEEMKRIGWDNQIKLMLIPAKNHLASFSHNPSSLRIFDLRREAEVCRFRKSGMSDAAFGPDGKHLYIGNGRDEVRACLWDPDDLIASAGSLLSRNLTPEEWVRYLPGEPYRRICSHLP